MAQLVKNPPAVPETCIQSLGWEDPLEKMRGRGAVGATSPRWLKWRKVKVKSISRVRLFATSWTVACQVPLSMEFSRPEYWSDLSLLQRIFPTQGLNPGLLHCRRILYQLSHRGSPGVLEWVAYPFSRGSSRPRNLTRVSCIARSEEHTSELQSR